MALTKVSYAMINGTPINALDYGATGDGVTDDSVAIQAAIDAAAALTPEFPSIYFPAGTYLIDNTLTVSSPIQFVGSGSSFFGSIVKASTGLNAPVFDVTAGAAFTNLTIEGSNVSGNTAERLVTIDNCNNVSFDNVTFLKSKIALDFPGSNPCFYVSILNCRFENTTNTFISINNSSSAGVDLIMDNTRFLGDMANYCWSWANGLGSAIVSNVQISTTGTYPSQQLVYFGTPASLYGGAQFTNCVFEGKEFLIVGTSALPWKHLFFNNCIFTGGTSSAFKFGAYATEIFFEQCGFSSTNTTGIVTFAAGTIINKIHINDCNWQGTGSETCLKSLGDSTLGLFVESPSWGGSGPFIDFSNVLVTSLVKLDVLGGQVGSNATPIQLANFTSTVKNVSTYGVNYGPLQHQTYVGTLDGSGNAVFAHGIGLPVGNAVSVVTTVNAYYRGSAGEMLPMTLNYVDGSNVSVSGGGGAAGRKYRVLVQYNTTQDTNW